MCHLDVYDVGLLLLFSRNNYIDFFCGLAIGNGQPLWNSVHISTFFEKLFDGTEEQKTGPIVENYKINDHPLDL